MRIIDFHSNDDDDVDSGPSAELIEIILFFALRGKLNRVKQLVQPRMLRNPKLHQCAAISVPTTALFCEIRFDSALYLRSVESFWISSMRSNQSNGHSLIEFSKNFKLDLQSLCCNPLTRHGGRRRARRMNVNKSSKTCAFQEFHCYVYALISLYKCNQS